MFCQVIQNAQLAYGIMNNTPICESGYLDEDLNSLPSSTPQNLIFGYEWIVSLKFPLVDPYTKKVMDFPQKLFDVAYLNADSINGNDPYFTQ